MYKKNMIALAVAGAMGALAAGGVGAYEAHGVATVIDGSESVGSKIIGGWNISDSDNLENKASAYEVSITPTSNITVDEVIGGNYFGLNQGTSGLIGTTSTVSTDTVTTTINNGIKVVEGVYGGQKLAVGFPDGGSDAASTFNLNTKTTNLSISGGEFGTFASENHADGEYGDAFRAIVTAGDFIKDRALNYGGVMTTTSSINTANLSVSDGTFHSVVFGGGVVAAYSGYNSAMSSNVTTSNVTVSGGTFKAPMFAGGAAYVMTNHGENPSYDQTPARFEGQKFVSNVTTANVDITGGTFEKGIYAGGLVAGGSGKHTTVEHKATVGTANINISNGAHVSAVYGSGAVGTFDKSNMSWTYSAGDAVKTNVNVTNAKVDVINVSNGSVNLRAEGEKGLTTVTTLQTTEGVTVKLSADGAANDASGGDITKLIKVTNGLGSNYIVSMDEGMYNGAVTGEAGTTKQHVSSVVVDTFTQVLSTTFKLNTLGINDIRKRLGDLRYTDSKNGAWARYDGGRLSASGVSNKFNTLQMGYDTVAFRDDVRLGAAVSYTRSDAEIRRGSADLDSYSLALYGTWMGDNGMFADVIGRVTTAKNDLTVDGDKTGDISNMAYSLSGEFGQRFDVAKNFFVEPQVEVTYTYVDSDTLRLNNGATYAFSSSDSVIGRIGFAAGWTCPNQKGQVYVRASALHEFMGDADVTTGNGRTYEEDGQDTWAEIGLGAQYNISKNAYVWADVERTQGAKMNEDFRGTVGVRFNF